MKNKHLFYPRYGGSLKKLWRIMKITLLLMIIGIFTVSAKVFSQESTISVKMQNGSLSDLFKVIEQKTEYRIFYKTKIVEEAKKVDINFTQETISTILTQLLSERGLSYDLIDKVIVITPSSDNNIELQQQKQRVTGKVTDQNGQSLVGVTVTLKGTTRAVLTDKSGSFNVQLQNANDKVLVFSFVGMKKQEVSIDGRSVINISMESESNALNEVVVIGYGTTSKANLTTSISKINPADVPLAANSTVNQMLFGRAAGLQVSQQSAEPGGNISLSIRGRKDPLIVVDGVAVPTNELEPGSGMGEINGVHRGGLGSINPNDIESIEVLKDASAAIYGVGASNGVILITTKKGKSGRMNVSYDGSHSVVKNMPYLTPLNPKDYMTYYNIFSKDVYDQAPKFSATDINNTVTGTDWLGQVLRTGSADNQTLNINGGNEQVTYYFSGNYYNQVGTMQNSDMTRFSGKLNVTFVLTKFIKLNANVSSSKNNYTNSTAGWQTGGSGSNGFGALQAAISYPTYLPIKNANGKYTEFATTGNPVTLLDINDKTITSTLYTNFSADIDLIKNMLTAKVLYGNNAETSNRNFYIPSYVDWGQLYLSRGTINDASRQNQTFETTLQFKKKVGKVLDIDGVVGYGQYITDNYGSGMYATGMLDAIGTDNMGAAPTRQYVSSYKNYDKKRSYFARGNFALLDRYLVSLTYRTDGTDKFYPAHKYASFPSASIGWKISKESFMSNFSFVELLKLRGSTGLTGQTIGSLAYGVYSPDGTQVYFAGANYTPYFQKSLDNPDLRWQKTLNSNAGLDFALFKNRISGSFDLFQDKITDLLIGKPTDQLSLVPMTYANGGSQIRNGYEFALKSANIVTKDFEWDMVANVTHYNWRWDTRYDNNLLASYVGIKDPVNVIYAFKTNGILKTGETPSAWQPAQAKMPGSPKFVDVNGDGKLDNKDVVMYNTDPKIILGFGTNFRYKNFDLGTFFYSQLGGINYNNNLLWASPSGIGSGTVGATNDIKDCWSTVNENGTLPGGKYNESSLGLPTGTDVRLVSTNFVRCRNITLGYTLNSGFIKGYISSLRVYADVQNAFIITNYKGGDPEVQAAAPKGAPAPYPIARVYSIGVNVNF